MGASVGFAPSSVGNLVVLLSESSAESLPIALAACGLGCGLLGVVIATYFAIMARCAGSQTPNRPFGTVNSLSIASAVVAALAAFLLPGDVMVRCGRAGFMMLGIASGLGTEAMLRTTVAAVGAHQPFAAITATARTIWSATGPPQQLGRYVALLTLGPGAAALAAAGVAVMVFKDAAAQPFIAFVLGAVVAAATAATLPVPGDPRPQEGPAPKRCMLLGNLHLVAFAACFMTGMSWLGQHGAVYVLLLMVLAHVTTLIALVLSPRITLPGLPAPASALLVAVGCAAPLCVVLTLVWLVPSAQTSMLENQILAAGSLGVGLCLALGVALLGGYFRPRSLPYLHSAPAVPPSIVFGGVTGIGLCGIGWVGQSSMAQGMHAATMMAVGVLVPIVAWATVSLADHLDTSVTTPQNTAHPAWGQHWASRSDAYLMPTASIVVLCALLAAVGCHIGQSLGGAAGATSLMNPSLLGGVVAGASLAAALAALASSEPGGARNHVCVGVSLAVATPIIVGSIGGVVALLGVNAGAIGGAVMLLLRRLRWSPAMGHVVTLAALTMLTGLAFSPAAVEMSVNDTVHSSVPWLVALAALGGAVAAATAPTPVSAPSVTQHALGRHRQHLERKVLHMSLQQSPQETHEGDAPASKTPVQATHLLSTVANRLPSRRRPLLASSASGAAPEEVDVRQSEPTGAPDVVCSGLSASVGSAGALTSVVPTITQHESEPCVEDNQAVTHSAATAGGRAQTTEASLAAPASGEPAVAVPVRRPSGQSILSEGHPSELLGGFSSIAADFIGTPKTKDA